MSLNKAQKVALNRYRAVLSKLELRFFISQTARWIQKCKVQLQCIVFTPKPIYNFFKLTLPEKHLFQNFLPPTVSNFSRNFVLQNTTAMRLDFRTNAFFSRLTFLTVQHSAPIIQYGKHGFSATRFSVLDYPLMVFHYIALLFQVFPLIFPFLNFAFLTGFL